MTTVIRINYWYEMARSTFDDAHDLETRLERDQEVEPTVYSQRRGPAARFLTEMVGAGVIQPPVKVQ